MDKNKIQIGIAPIGWTNDDLPELGKENTFQQCISEMALAGFEGCEIGNKFPRNVTKLKYFLDLRQLQIANAWFSTFFTIGQKKQTIAKFVKFRDFLYSLGAKVIGVSEQGHSIQGDRSKNIFTDKHIFLDKEWELLCEGLEELALLCEEKGMKLAFHHHMGTGVQTEQEIDKLMNKTSNKIHLLIDTGHLYFATNSQKTLEIISQKYINRTCHIHLKDVRNQVLQNAKEKGLSFLDCVFNGIFTIPGDGIINFKPFFNIVNQSQYKGWMIVEAEQDPALANPFEYALMARKFIKEETGI